MQHSSILGLTACSTKGPDARRNVSKKKSLLHHLADRSMRVPQATQPPLCLSVCRLATDKDEPERASQTQAL